MSWYFNCFKKYAVFNGRSSRKEYWIYTIINMIILAILGGGTYYLFNMNKLMYGTTIASIYTIIVLLPTLAVSVRRLHDTGKSGWWFLINLLPVIGNIWFIILMLIDSQTGTNEYGPNPKNSPK